jgi:PEP-CTERM motif
MQGIAMRYLSKPLQTAIAASAFSLCAASAQAYVIYETGNHQFDAVNLDAAITVHEAPVTAYINSVPHVPFYISDPHDADGNPISYLHASSGVASFEAWSCDPTTDADCANGNAAHVPFFSIAMSIEPGWGISAMDWKLDRWDDRIDSNVTFTAYDFAGALIPVGCLGIDNTFAMRNGQSAFQLATCDGELVSRLVVTADGSGLSDIKQISVQAERIPTVPEPGTLALLALGLGGLVWLRRKPVAAM